ncbi:MAG: DUF1849 family protein [Alphaproteobacteria bacterium]|nr:DUF1849 family protein [Alphaproteobacteria bacterium]
MRRLLLAALLLAPLLAPEAAPVPGAEDMAAHRAAYRLVLDRTRDSGGIQRAEGAMLFEVQDACEGWATRQRFTLVVHDRDGNTIETTSDYSTFEAKDGRSLRFSLTQITEGAVTSRISGEATMADDGGRVVFQDPTPNEMRLAPGTLFPMLHTIRSLAAARAGQRILVAPLLDGTDEDGPQDSTTLILGGWQNATPHPRHASLSDQGSARMRISFFDVGQAGGTPSYEVSLRYFANGVADELKMDFGEFTVEGALVELSPLPGGC